MKKKHTKVINETENNEWTNECKSWRCCYSFINTSLRFAGLKFHLRSFQHPLVPWFTIRKYLCGASRIRKEINLLLISEFRTLTNIMYMKVITHFWFSCFDGDTDSSRTEKMLGFPSGCANSPSRHRINLLSQPKLVKLKAENRIHKRRVNFLQGNQSYW